MIYNSIPSIFTGQCTKLTTGATTKRNDSFNQERRSMQSTFTNHHWSDVICTYSFGIMLDHCNPLLPQEESYRKNPKSSIESLFKVWHALRLFHPPFLRTLENKRAESEIFAIFPVEVTKTIFTTNCGHLKNYVQSMRHLEHWLYKNQVK